MTEEDLLNNVKLLRTALVKRRIDLVIRILELLEQDGRSQGPSPEGDDPIFSA